MDITFIGKEQLIDLRAEGWTAEKVEGICMVDDKTIAVINDNDFGIVTKVVDEENPDADITDYIYDSEAKTYTYEEKEAASVIGIEENTEPAQIWIFTE